MEDKKAINLTDRTVDSVEESALPPHADSPTTNRIDEMVPLCHPERPSYWGLFKQNWHSTMIYCSLFWSFGMCVAFLGPTLLDIGCQTTSDLKNLSWVFLPQTLCNLIGAISAGYSVGRISGNFVMVIASFCMALCMLVIPFCKDTVTLCIALGVMGLNMGAIDCLANLQMIQVFDGAVSPFLQAMHFCYGLGAFVSPMISEPFLLNEDCSVFIDSSNGSAALQYSNNSYPSHTLQDAQDTTHVRYAFWIMAALQIPIPLLALTLAWKDNWWIRIGKHSSLKEEMYMTVAVPTTTPLRGEEQLDSQGQKKPMFFNALQYLTVLPRGHFQTKWKHIIGVTCCAALVVFLYDGLQSAYGGYVYAYALKSIAGMNKTEGAYLNACFWGTFAMGRLVSIPVATVFSPAFMLMCNIMGCLVSSILMLSMNHDHTMLYIGTGFLGLFLSSVYPSTLSLAEQYIDLNSSLTTIIIVVAAIGEMSFPVLIGQMFYHFGPISLLIYTVTITALSAILYMVLITLGRGTPKHHVARNHSFLWSPGFWLEYVSNQAPHDQQMMTPVHSEYTTEAIIHQLDASEQLDIENRVTLTDANKLTLYEEEY